MSTTTTTDAAYLAIIDAAEARLAALEAAARAVVDDMTSSQAIGRQCGRCLGYTSEQPHQPWCPIGKLAALLEEGA